MGKIKSVFYIIVLLALATGANQALADCNPYTRDFDPNCDQQGSGSGSGAGDTAKDHCAKQGGTWKGDGECDFSGGSGSGGSSGSGGDSEGNSGGSDSSGSGDGGGDGSSGQGGGDCHGQPCDGNGEGNSGDSGGNDNSDGPGYLRRIGGKSARERIKALFNFNIMSDRRSPNVSRETPPRGLTGPFQDVNRLGIGRGAGILGSLFPKFLFPKQEGVCNPNCEDCGIEGR